MKRLVLAVGMICVLSASVIGGEIPSVPVAPPPPDGMTATSPGLIPTVGSAVTGDIPSVGLAVTASDFLTVLQTVFGLM